MRPSTARRQAECLAFIRRYQGDTGGVSPSLEEIAAHMGLASKSGALRLVVGLEARGKVRRLPTKARAIEVVGMAAPVDVLILPDAELKALADRVAAELERRAA